MLWDNYSLTWYWKTFINRENWRVGFEGVVTYPFKDFWTFHKRLIDSMDNMESDVDKRIEIRSRCRRVKTGKDTRRLSLSLSLITKSSVTLPFWSVGRDFSNHYRVASIFSTGLWTLDRLIYIYIYIYIGSAVGSRPEDKWLYFSYLFIIFILYKFMWLNLNNFSFVF